MPDSVQRLLEVYDVVEQIALVLEVLLCDDSTVVDLFYCAPAVLLPAVPQPCL